MAVKYDASERMEELPGMSEICSSMFRDQRGGGYKFIMCISTGLKKAISAKREEIPNENTSNTGPNRKIIKQQHILCYIVISVDIS